MGQRVVGQAGWVGKSGVQFNCLWASLKMPKKRNFSECLGDSGRIRREELVRIVVQCMRELGYDESSRVLEAESGVMLHSAEVGDFRDNVLQGNWDVIGETLPMVGDPNAISVRFLVYEQNYLEALYAGDFPGALETLRRHLGPLGCRPERVQELSSWAMTCGSPEAVRIKAGWAVGEDCILKARHALLLSLQSHVAPGVLVPEGRLINLVEQALEGQVQRCAFHNTKQVSFSLFEDHVCTRQQIPTRTVAVLRGHSDEVWHVQFSHDGTRLASASKDNSVIIWDVSQLLNCDGSGVVWVGDKISVDGISLTPPRLHTLIGHTNHLSFVAWSPDDSMLLSCSNDKTVRLWRISDGACLQILCQHEDSVTSCAWFPDNRRFVSGGLDKCVYQWDIDGKHVKLQAESRINDLVISSDGSFMVSVCSDKKIHILTFDTQVSETITEDDSITSIFLSNDGRYLLLNLSQECIHIWDLQAKKLVHTYEGQRQGRYVIRSCLGGTNQSFVASGSEDSQVYIWHRASEELLNSISGHSGTVNAVCWNPVDPHMFATASDDHTIRVWGL